eukprot:1803578-Rhodomonas_salina.1
MGHSFILSMQPKQAEQHPVVHVARWLGLYSNSPAATSFLSCFTVFWQITHSAGKIRCRISAVEYAGVANDSSPLPGTYTYRVRRKVHGSR